MTRQEENDMVLQNLNLVHFVLHKYGKFSNLPDYEDLTSVGILGLIKASKSYEPQKRTAFSSYAYMCIRNELGRYFRATNRYRNNMSIEDVVFYEGKNSSALESSVFKEKVEKIEQDEEFVKLVNIILNSLEGRERFSLLYTMSHKRQIDIAKRLGINRAHVCRIVSSSVERIKNLRNMQVQTEKIKFQKNGDTYVFKFSNFKNYDMPISKFNNFQINYQKDDIIIRTLADSEVFANIAEILEVEAESIKK